MPTVTINIAGRGTQLENGTTSSVGHMWYSLTDDNGAVNSYGFAPDKQHHGEPFAPGEVYENDDSNYQGPRAYTTTIEITQEQYDAMKSFGKSPDAYGFNSYYNGLSNSCIDFTYKALEVAGMNPVSYQGFIWPTWNASAVSDFILNNSPDWENLAMAHPYFAIRDALDSMGIGDALAAMGQTAGQAELEYQDAVRDGLTHFLENLNDTLQTIGQSEQASAEAMADGVDHLLAAARDLILAAGQVDQETAEVMAAGVGQLFSSLDDLLQSAGCALNGSLAAILLGLADSGAATAALLATIKNLFQTAEITRSPLVLDLDGDGVETLGTAAGIHFDHDGNGFAETTGWAGADDGLLVWDRNGNGTIDDGSELFGNNTLLTNGQKAANGFAALAELDTNHDGIVDAADDAYSQLMVWKDGDSNAQVGDGELLSLESTGIASLATGFTAQTVTDAQGNRHLQAGQYTATGGSTRAMDDVWFANDTARTIDLDLVEVDPATAALPGLQGLGNVRSLHQAMARDESGTLRSLVEASMAETDPAARTAIVTQLIYVWAGVDNIDPNSRAASMIYGNVIGDARKLAALEAFLGESYVGVWCWGTPDPNPHGQAAPVLLKAFDTLAVFVSAQLMQHTHLAPLFDSLALAWDPAAQAFDFDITATLAALHAAYDEDAAAGLALLDDFASSLKTKGDPGQHVLSLLRDQGDAMGAGFSSALATMGYQVILGDASNNSLLGGTDDDTLTGNEGADTLRGDDGNDTLFGDVQNFIWIDDISRSDTLTFGAGVTLANLENNRAPSPVFSLASPVSFCIFFILMLCMSVSTETQSVHAGIGAGDVASANVFFNDKLLPILTRENICSTRQDCREKEVFFCSGGGYENLSCDFYGIENENIIKELAIESIKGDNKINKLGFVKSKFKEFKSKGSAEKSIFYYVNKLK